MAVGMNGAVHAVRVDEIGVHPERIGMGIEGVALRVVHHHRTVGRLHVAKRIGIKTIVAPEHVLVHHIGIFDIAKGLAQLLLTFPHHTVAHQALAVVGEDAALQQIGQFPMGVIVAQFRIDMAVTVVDIGGTHHMCNGCACIVVERIGDDDALGRFGRCRIHKAHVVIEHRIARGRIVFTPVAGQFVSLVHQPAALEEIAQVVETVIVEAVGIKDRIAMGEHHILPHTRQLVHAVVIEHIPVKGERIALHKPHMAEGIKRVGSLIVERTVAIHENAIVLKLHVAHKELGREAHTVIKEHAIDMQQMHPGVGRLPLCLGLGATRSCCQHHTQACRQQRTYCQGSAVHHLIHPG